MTVDLSPPMITALSSIGIRRSVTATDLGVNGCVMKRLWELGFLCMDFEKSSYFPPAYSLSRKGEGAAAVLNAIPVVVDREQPIARIQRIVAQHFRIPVEEMVSERRSRKVARPRQVAMYLAKRLTPKSLPDIGRRFGGRDHTTVMHAIHKVEALMSEDHNFKDDVRTLTGILVSEQSTNLGDKPQVSSFAPESTGA